MKYEFTEEEKSAIMSVIELDLTEDCNISCTSCSKVCGLAPSKDYLPLELIQKFVADSLALNWKWRMITLIGGEPTMHPNFREILEVINEYRVTNPSMEIRLLTNGLDTFKAVEHLIPKWIHLVDNSENKSKPNQGHRAFHVAPIDIGEWDENNYIGCDFYHYCGMQLSLRGYYLCPIGSTLARIFHLPDGIKELKDVTIEKMFQGQEEFCKVCGWYLVKTEKCYDYPVDHISPTWKKALEEYNKKK